MVLINILSFVEIFCINRIYELINNWLILFNCMIEFINIINTINYKCVIVEITINNVLLY